MTLTEFISLNENDKLTAFMDGIYVGEYADNDYIYICKQVDDFYIEFVAKGAHYIGMKCHRDTAKLDPYLEDMDIDIL